MCPNRVTICDTVGVNDLTTRRAFVQVVLVSIVMDFIRIEAAVPVLVGFTAARQVAELAFAICGLLAASTEHARVTRSPTIGIALTFVLHLLITAWHSAEARLKVSNDLIFSAKINCAICTLGGDSTTVYVALSSILNVVCAA